MERLVAIIAIYQMAGKKALNAVNSGLRTLKIHRMRSCQVRYGNMN